MERGRSEISKSTISPSLRWHSGLSIPNELSRCSAHHDAACEKLLCTPVALLSLTTKHPDSHNTLTMPPIARPVSIWVMLAQSRACNAGVWSLQDSWYQVISNLLHAQHASNCKTYIKQPNFWISLTHALQVWGFCKAAGTDPSNTTTWSACQQLHQPHHDCGRSVPRMQCRCGDSAGQLSLELSFVTAPAISPDAFPQRIGIIGDLGQTENSSSTLAHLIANEPPVWYSSVQTSVS